MSSGTEPGTGAGEPAVGPRVEPRVEPGVEPESARALAEQVAPVVEALPGLARVAASAAWHTGEWGVRSYVRSAKRLARAATDREEAAHLAQEATEAAQVVSDLARAVSAGTPVGTALLRAAESLGAVREPAGRSASTVVPGGLVDRDEPQSQSLRERGAELLERSRDVWSSEAGHPAYERILTELAPDEARILVLLLEKGPYIEKEPSNDGEGVKTPFGRIKDPFKDMEEQKKKADAAKAEAAKAEAAKAGAA